MAVVIASEEDRDKKRRDRLQERQKKLDNLLRDSRYEWSVIEPFMYYSEEGLNPNHTDSNTGVTTAMMAAYDGQTDILRWCLERKADLEARTALGRSALHYACDGGRPGAIRELLIQGADVNARTLGMMTPLHLCCQGNHYEAVLVLLKESPQVVDLDIENSKRQTADKVTKDKRIQRCIKNYRASVDEKKQAELMDGCLHRLFKLFDKDGRDYILPEAWVETHSMLSRILEIDYQDEEDAASDDSRAKDEFLHGFDAGDKNSDGQISWEEFRSNCNSMLEPLGLPVVEMCAKVNDVEGEILQERLRQEEERLKEQGITTLS